MVGSRLHIPPMLFAYSADQYILTFLPNQERPICQYVCCQNKTCHRIAPIRCKPLITKWSSQSAPAVRCFGKISVLKLFYLEKCSRNGSVFFSFEAYKQCFVCFFLSIQFHFFIGEDFSNYSCYTCPKKFGAAVSLLHHAQYQHKLNIFRETMSNHYRKAIEMPHAVDILQQAADVLRSKAHVSFIVDVHQTRNMSMK